MNDTQFNDTRCAVVTGQEFCNVTIMTWVPRFDTSERLAALLVPSIYALIMMVLLYLLWDSKLKEQDGVSFPNFMQGIYQRNRRLLYMRHHAGESYHQMKEGTEDIVYHVESASVLTRFSINGEVSRLPDLSNGEIFELDVTCADIKTAKKHRKFLKFITLPLFCAKFTMIFKLLALPLFSIIWNLVDVYFDAFYFYQLESGGLIDERIWRNTRVTDGILAFSCLGAFVSTIVALFYFGVVYSYEREHEHHSYTVFAKMLASSTKLLLEDAPELLLEYYFVDKYIVSGIAITPWYLVAKDIVTALIYILPLYQIASTGKKDFKLTKEKAGWFGCLVYSSTTVARVFMSLSLVFRVVGMIIQYMKTTVNLGCYDVINASLLVQTPFTGDCLNWCDWTVLLFTCLTLGSAIPTALLTVFSMCLYICGFRHKE